MRTFKSTLIYTDSKSLNSTCKLSQLLYKFFNMNLYQKEIYKFGEYGRPNSIEKIYFLFAFDEPILGC